MMTRTTLALVGALLAVVSGCDSEVNGGGGGAGGEGSGGAESIATGTGGNPTTTATTATGDTTVTGATSTGTGGAGGNTLGECVDDGTTTAGSSSGTFECGSELTCDGGAVEVNCVDDGTTETCDCNLDGAFVGTCVDEDRSGCSFPQNCCFNLLGGQAQPDPGPYGACEENGGTGQTSGGSQMCTSFLECDGGEAQIDCEQAAGGADATCECSDGQGFVLGTCTQPSLDCSYQQSCCYDVLN
jgi:hypothetical protein